ncbi:hypothetical protein FACS189454_00850 [Planctomycetales bacterium]|nr:hypothetical protein FACS189454_00850 [Planctomycetales bacterium]
MKNIETNRWQRFGISQITMDSKLNYCHELLSNPKHDRVGLLNKNIIPDDWNLHRTISDLDLVLTVQHFGCPNKFPLPTDICKEIIQLSQEFLFGEWQYTTVWHDSGKLLDKNKARKKLDWYDSFLSGLRASLLLDDNDSTKKIVCFPDIDVMKKPDSFETTKEDSAIVILLAYWIREGHMPQSKQLVNCITKSIRRRPKLLLSCLEAIDKMDESLFIQSMKKYLKFFYDSDITRPVAQLNFVFRRL